MSGDTKISQLPAAGTITGAELLPGVQAGSTVSFSMAALGAYISSNLVNITYSGLLTGPAAPSYTDTGVLAQFASSVNSYNQIILQNKSSGAAASTNFNVSNDQGSATTNFAEFGINSSTFSGTGSFSQPGNAYIASASSDLVIGTYSAKSVRFVINSGATDAATIDTNGNLNINPGQAAVAGGSTVGLRLGAPAVGVFFGSGVPTISAAQGSLYLRTDGSSTSTRMYVNTNGSTGWTAVTTAA